MVPLKGEVLEQLDKVVDKVGNRYRLCVLLGLNGWVADRLRAGITGGFRLP